MIVADAIKRLPGARVIARSMRRAWEDRRPIPRPRYPDLTPRIGGDDPYDPFLPPTAATIGGLAMSEDAAEFAGCVLERLTPTRLYDVTRFLYKTARAKYGRHRRYADLPTALWAAAALVRPRAYLEIGVWRGRSAAVLGAACPDCGIYGFDRWDAPYADEANPGPDFVRGELLAAGHRGEVVLVQGDSRRTLPAFLAERPDLFFDIVTIDGDKSVFGAANDFANALPRLRVGGVLLFDDLAEVPALRRVWDRAVRTDRRYATWEFDDGGSSVAVAVRLR